MNREIPRLVSCPSLTERQVGFLTDVCFGTAIESAPCEGVFVFGSSVHRSVIAKVLADRFVLSPPRALILSGGLISEEDGLTEAESLFCMLRSEGIPRSIQVHLETRSTNTLDNVRFSLSFLEELAECRVAFVSHAYAAGRASRTLQAHVRTGRSYRSQPVPVWPGSGSLTSADWYASASQRDTVWAEYLRIVRYGMRGDISFADIADAGRLFWPTNIPPP